MATILLLISVTVLYAGYNLLVKISSEHVPNLATSTVMATICLQIAALGVSSVFAIYLLSRGGQILQLSWPTYAWAAMAGLCIGAAEIGYFYLFGNFTAGKSLSASVVIPTVVCGTVIIAVIASQFLFKESISGIQITGAIVAMIGIVMIYTGNQA